MTKNILFIIDELELKYFEFNDLVTNFWFIKEFLKRDYNVSIAVKRDLFVESAKGCVFSRETYLKEEDIFYKKEMHKSLINDFDTVFFRPDPPVDIDYINASYILSYTDKKTVIMNSPKAIREKNEKLYINEFQKLIPDNIISSDEKIIKEFLFDKKEIIIKPTNRCFGSGVFYLNDKDKNINTIIQTATNNYETAVMVQEYLPGIQNGDKRLIYVCGEVLEYCVNKVATNNDFKFNEHNKNTLKFASLSDKEKLIENYIKDKFENDGIYLAGLDVIDGKIIEINITSPCFFINEINEIFNINLEKIIVDKIENYVNSKKGLVLNTV